MRWRFRPADQRRLSCQSLTDVQSDAVFAWTVWSEATCCVAGVTIHTLARISGALLLQGRDHSASVSHFGNAARGGGGQDTYSMQVLLVQILAGSADWLKDLHADACQHYSALSIDAQG